MEYDKKLLMLLKSKLLLFFGALLASYIASAQQRTFSPQLWLNNPKESKSYNERLRSLNNYSTFTLDINTLNSSINKIDSNNHLFLVYRSNGPENIVSVLGRTKSLFLNSDKIRVNDSIVVSGYNEHYGELLDVKFGGFAGGRFWMNPHLQNTTIYEFILVNRNNGNFKINEIRTYLSLKYGIDLIDYRQYEYNNKQLWDSSDKQFANRIFGLAKFTAFNLDLNQAVHSKDLDLMITISEGYKNSLKDGNYILFGHNNKTLTFNRQTNESNKQWLVTTDLDYMKLDVMVPLSKLKNTISDYNLVVSDDKGAINYKGSIKDSVYIFKNVFFSKDKKSLIKIKETFGGVKLDITNTCNEFAIAVKPAVDIKSYSMKIKDDTGNIIYESDLLSSKFSTKDISSRYYDILITYNGEVLKKKISSYSGTLATPLLKNNYVLDGDAVQISIPENQYKKVEWYKGATKIGFTHNIELTTAGNYSVKVTTDENCSQEQQFTVSASYAHEGWQVFPNPVNTTEDLNIFFQFEKDKNVDIKIFSIDGKLIKEFQLGTIRNKTINIGRISGASGTYMLVAYIDNVPQIQKIIIK